MYQSFAARIAYFGMSLFFILSGFVIDYNYGKLIREKGMLVGGWQFIAARFARLYPLYMVAIFFSLDSLQSAYFQKSEYSILMYATLTQAWFNAQNIFFEPAWSISDEWFFYLAYLVLLPLIARIRRPIWVLIAFVLLVFIYMPSIIKYTSMLFTDISSRSWIIYYAPFIRVFEFLTGVVASRVYLSMQSQKRNLNIIGHLTMLICLGWIVTVIVMGPLQTRKIALLGSNFIYAPAIVTLMLLCCSYNHWLGRLLSSRVLMQMGEISYSVYLLQFWVLTALANSFVLKAVPTFYDVDPYVKMLAIVTLTTMLAYGSYHLFEMPARRLIRNFLCVKLRHKKLEETEFVLQPAAGKVLS